MIKFYCSYENPMKIKSLNETALNSRCIYEKRTNTYNSVPIFDTLEECIKYLGSYSKVTILPDGEEIIPLEINYPSMDHILKPVRFPVFGY